VPGANYKFMQVLGLGGVCKLFVENEIAVLRFWDGNLGFPGTGSSFYYPFSTLTEVCFLIVSKEASISSSDAKFMSL